MNDEGGKRSDPFQRASDDVLKGRKIVKASKKWGGVSASGGGGGGGIFGSVNLVTSKPAEVNGEKEGEASAPAVFGSTAKVPSFGSAVNLRLVRGLALCLMDLDRSKPPLLPRKTKARKTRRQRHSGRDSDLYPLDLVLSNLLVRVLERLKQNQPKLLRVDRLVHSHQAPHPQPNSSFKLLSLANGEEGEDCMYEVR